MTACTSSEPDAVGATDDDFAPAAMAELFDADSCSVGPGELWTTVFCDTDGDLGPIIYFRPDDVDQTAAAERFDTRYFVGSDQEAPKCEDDSFDDRTGKLFDFRVVVGDDYWAEVTGEIDEVLAEAQFLTENLGGVILKGPEFCERQTNPMRS